MYLCASFKRISYLHSCGLDVTFSTPAIYPVTATHSETLQRKK